MYTFVYKTPNTMKNLLIAVILLVTISCSKKDDPTPEPTPVVNESLKFTGTFMVSDTGVFSHTYTSSSGNGNEGCMPPFIIDRHHESVISSLGTDKIRISNFFGDGFDEEFVLTNSMSIKTGSIYIKSNGCQETLAFDNYNQPEGYISNSLDTIIIEFEYNDTYVLGTKTITKHNDFTSTFVRQ